MKKLLILILFIGFSVNAQNPDYHRYGARTKFVQPDTLSTIQRNALTPKLGTLIYHKDTGISQWEVWDGVSWEELGGSGAVESVQGYIGVVVINPDDLDDTSTTNKFVTSTEKGLIATALQTETDPIFSAWDKDYNDLTNKPVIPTKLLADSITVDTSGFTKNLTVADSTVQKALKTLDGLIGGSTTISADSVYVSPTIRGIDNAYDLLYAYKTSIDSIQSNMNTGVNTAFRSVTSTAGVFTEAFNESQPNFRLSLDEDAEVEINDAVNGNFIIAEVVNDDVSEDTFKVTFVGTNKNIIAYLDHGEKAYFTMITNQEDEMIWFRNYEDAGTDKVVTVEGEVSTKINWSVSPYYKVLLGASNDTLSFTHPNESKHLRLEIVQDGVGGREIAFSQNVYAEGGILPSLTSAANAIDVIDLFYDKQQNIYYLNAARNNFEEITGTPALVYLDVSGKTYLSNGHGTNPPSYSFDGNINTYSATNNQINGWVGIDFGEDVTVAQIELLPRQGGGSNTARINGTQLRYSTNGTTWTNIGSPISGVDDNNYTDYVIISFSPVSARYWSWINPNSTTYSGNVAEAKFKGYED